MKRTYQAIGGLTVFLSTLPTFVAAQAVNIELGLRRGRRPSSVPEIDASTGAMALAAVAAALVLAWEINRRRKSA